MPEEYGDYLKALNNFMAMDNNYTTYRTKLATLTPPLVPYVGLLLRDLTFIDDGNPTRTGDKARAAKARRHVPLS